MKRHAQLPGVRKWAGDDLLDLQRETFKVIDGFFAEYNTCVLTGCGVSAVDSGYRIGPGLVALSGKDHDGEDTFKVVPFEGKTTEVLPVYLTLNYSVIEEEYVDQSVKPVAYDYYADLSALRPDDGPFLEIGLTGVRRFVDAIKLTEKLDKTGDGRDVTVSFSEAAERVMINSGEKLAVIVGKIVRWLSDLKNVAFSGEAKDLSTDSAHRFTTDDEKTAWNGKAAGSHRHPASQVDEEADKRFLTDAERVKIADTYTKAQSDTTNTNVLQGAKDYTDSAVSGAKSHTDNAFAQVYKKNETYTREEINTGDAGTLALAREYASQKIAEVVGSSPEALNTLYELAAALNNDPNFATSIMALISGKADSWHQHTRAQITDFPSSMPASDVYDWAKQPDKPGYSPAEVGAAPASHNHSRSQITDFPSSLPASDVYEWAKQPGKPGYTPGEVGAAPANHGHTASQITEEVDKRFMTDAERSKLANIETAGEWMELQVSATGNANTAYYLWIKVLNGYFILKFGGDWTAGARPQDPFVVSNFNFGVLPQSVIYISAYYGDGASAISVRKFTFVFAGHAIYIRNVDHIEDETGFSPEGEFMFPIPQDGAFGPVI